MNHTEHNLIFDNHILLSLGTNLGNREENLRSAFSFLNEIDSFKNVRMSSFYETEPVGYSDQPWFLNAVVSGYTYLTAEHLLILCKSLEYMMGRRKRERWHEREIDIDILLYNDSVFSDLFLTIPHPQMLKRRFVLQPAAEIASNILHPSANLPLGQLLDNCEDTSVVRRYN